MENGTVLTREQVFKTLFATAVIAGREAGEKAVPNPMVVYEAELDDTPKEGGKAWYVEDGVCGFAWVVVKPGNCPFANFLKKEGFGRYSQYDRGVVIWISDWNQSLTRKEAHAYAMAKVLRENGIEAYASSRID